MKAFWELSFWRYLWSSWELSSSFKVFENLLRILQELYNNFWELFGSFSRAFWEQIVNYFGVSLDCLGSLGELLRAFWKLWKLFGSFSGTFLEFFGVIWKTCRMLWSPILCIGELKYVENMEKYVEDNMKKYVEDMKKYVKNIIKTYHWTEESNLRSVCSYLLPIPLNYFPIFFHISCIFLHISYLFLYISSYLLLLKILSRNSHPREI